MLDNAESLVEVVALGVCSKQAAAQQQQQREFRISQRPRVCRLILIDASGSRAAPAVLSGPIVFKISTGNCFDTVVVAVAVAVGSS
jgi:hypothetical protein